jgi:membrane glycosyltransferase
MGGTLAAMACLSAPAAVPYLFPVAVPMMLAPLLTWFSARPGCGAWLVRYGIVATPEELNPPAEVVMAGHDVRASSAGAAREPAAGSLGRGGAGIDALTPVGQ